jgi:hypothetical protein
MHIRDRDLQSYLAGEVGAPLVGAVYARVATSASVARRLGLVGNYAVARPAARMAARNITKRTGVPMDAAVVLGLTADTLHLWSADPLRNDVLDHLGSVPLSRVAAMMTVTDKSWQALTIVLDDEETIEIQARGDVNGFVAAFEHTRPLSPEPGQATPS